VSWNCESRKSAILRNPRTGSHGLHRNGWDPRAREHLGLAGSSAVTRTETTTIAGIHPGDTVLAVGTAGKNGTVAATQVRVTPAATSS
jgi:hypothetical protein